MIADVRVSLAIKVGVSVNTYNKYTMFIQGLTSLVKDKNTLKLRSVHFGHLHS